MRWLRSAGASSEFSGYDAPSSPAFGFVSVVEIAAAAAGWVGSAVRLSRSRCHVWFTKNGCFWPKHSGGMDLHHLLGLLERFSCPLAFTTRVKRCEGRFSEKASPVLSFSFETGARKARCCRKLEAPGQSHQPQPPSTRRRPLRLCPVTPQDLGARCRRCSAAGKNSGRRTKAARIQL